MASPTFTPLHDRLLVKRVEDNTSTIILTDKEKPQQGEVISVGKGKKTDEGKVIPLDVKVGDIVVFGQYSGSKVAALGEDFVILREEEVFGVLNK